MIVHTTEEGITFRDDVSVMLIDHKGSDALAAEMARVSRRGTDYLVPSTARESSADDEKLVDKLVKWRHGSPFEHNVVTVSVEAPIFVVRQWHRHRTQSYNEMSGRYAEMHPEFWVPCEGRNVLDKGRKDNRMADVWKTDGALRIVRRSIIASSSNAWRTYKAMVDQGVVREVARSVLPLNTYTSFYATANLRNWWRFLHLRSDPAAQEEIRQIDEELSSILHALYPCSMRAWENDGRPSF